MNTENVQNENDTKYSEGISYGGVNPDDSNPNENENSASNESDDENAERLSDFPEGNETDDVDESETDDENFEKDPEHPKTDPSKLDQL